MEDEDVLLSTRPDVLIHDMRRQKGLGSVNHIVKAIMIRKLALVSSRRKECEMTIANSYDTIENGCLLHIV